MTPPPPGHIVDAIRVEMTKAHSKLDPAKVLKKEKQLVYVFSGQGRPPRVTKRFSEEKFWDSLKIKRRLVGLIYRPHIRRF